MPLEVIGDDSNLVCLNASRASHGVAQVAIHSQVASFWTGDPWGLEFSMSIMSCGYGDVLIVYIYLQV
jgi:hypothetical protein